MNAREEILVQIRRGLSTAAPKPNSHAGTRSGAPLSIRQVLPATGANFEENVALFRQNAQELKADFYLVQDLDELRRRLLELRDAEGWQRVGIHAGALTNAVGEGLALPICRTDAPYSIADLESCAAGITECDALVAQTGSVLITSRSAGGRALSVLPPHHVVLARRSQLVPGLPDAFALLKEKYAANYPSLISFITGPSRTGDIERILVLGAHGPKKLTIFCLEAEQ